MARRNKNARAALKHVAVEELVVPPPEQLAKGTWKRDFVIDENTGLQALAYRNTGHDPVARWESSGKLDQRQIAVIDTVRRLWDLGGVKQRVTANYGERIAGGGCNEMFSTILIDAKDDLKRIQGYFFGLEPYWNCFENVCRFGIAAGLAGAELGFGTRSAEDRAHQIVCFVTDIIGTKEHI